MREEQIEFPMLDDKGREMLDPNPIAIPVPVLGFRNEYDRIKAIIKHELSIVADSEGFETFEEADDFDVGDDYDPTSPFEEQFDPDTGESLWTRPINPPETPPQEGELAPPPVPGSPVNLREETPPGPED